MDELKLVTEETRAATIDTTPPPAVDAAPLQTAVDAALGLTNQEVASLADGSFERTIMVLAMLDAKGLARARQDYGESWASRGGVGAFMNCARKWDRFETMASKFEGTKYDVFELVVSQVVNGGEGGLDAIRDLRRYLLLIEEKVLHLLPEGQALPFSRDNRD